jgi:hypothetical protein
MSTALVTPLHGNHPSAASTGIGQSSFASPTLPKKKERQLFSASRPGINGRSTVAVAPVQRHKTSKNRQRSRHSLQLRKPASPQGIRGPEPIVFDPPPSIAAVPEPIHTDSVNNAIPYSVLPPRNIGSLFLFGETVLIHQKDGGPIELIIESLAARCMPSELFCEVAGTGNGDKARRSLIVHFARESEIVMFEWQLYKRQPRGTHIPLWSRRKSFETGLVGVLPVNVGGMYIIFRSGIPFYVGCSTNNLRGALHLHLSGHGNDKIREAVQARASLDYTIAPLMSFHAVEAQLVAERGSLGSLSHLQSQVDLVDRCR